MAGVLKRQFPDYTHMTLDVDDLAKICSVANFV